MNEDSRAGNDFLAQLCVQWEQAALDLEPATRVVVARLGIVLGMIALRATASS